MTPMTDLKALKQGETFDFGPLFPNLDLNGVQGKVISLKSDEAEVEATYLGVTLGNALLSPSVVDGVPAVRWFWK